MFQRWCFSLFSNYFKITASNQSYCTRSISNDLVFKRLYNTIRYGNISVFNSTVSNWNHLTIFHVHNLFILSPKDWNHLFLIFFLKAMKNSLCVFTIIVHIYVINIYLYVYVYVYVYIYIYTYIYIFIYLSIHVKYIFTCTSFSCLHKNVCIEYMVCMVICKNV